ncbi:MAG: hypothetical protein HZT40_16535 [Candidatus Thiothrix singaporensis]|uniref:Cytochrome c7-like domain-containing protein n=1 Tax=Candidatus Thiothrix singaporensis TaxID=2799669 RepID=A0A7L6AV50_9GAMM|nr:MAG: hypothetical protein HZT40_16535 [Candidatus Thiothrix singaporensis]
MPLLQLRLPHAGGCCSACWCGGASTSPATGGKPPAPAAPHLLRRRQFRQPNNRLRPPAETAAASPDTAAAPADAAVQPNPADTARCGGCCFRRHVAGRLWRVSGYPGQQPPMVLPRKDKLSFYPCAQCHANMPVNTTPRPIMIHATAGLVDGKLDHGQQRFWCLTCHSPTDRNNLQTVAGVKVDFNDAWKVCGQCHSARQRDWYYGAHGKRVGNWKGDVERYNCTECHNPHHPPFRQQKPQPKPPVRAGLGEMPHEGESEGHPTIWEKHQDRLQPEEGNKP